MSHLSRKSFPALILFLCLAPIAVYAADPVVSNVKALQRTDGTKIVDITYDVSDADSEKVMITLKISSDGVSYDIAPAFVSGDVGVVTVGKGKRIVWDSGKDLPGRYGKRFKAAVTADDDLNKPKITINLPNLPTGAKPLEMVLIPAGTFTMGSPNSEQDRDSDEGPQHQVTLTKPFYLGKFEVTQAQWQAVMGSNPSYFKGNNLPVEQVSWNDCQTFIQKLNQLGQGTFRLPTEAEWEYACRAGKTTRFYWGDDSSYAQIGNYAWYSSNSSSKTHEVGLKLPNAWGLYDMSGNVYEWCQDWYGDYSSVSHNDPTGANSGDYRVLRGGGWSGIAGGCRSAYRDGDWPDSRNDSDGFRVCRTK